MSFLTVKNINKKFGSTEVLRGIDFAVNKGEVVSIIGSSGSGKTTLLRCLNFLEIADVGEISVDGEIIFRADGEHTLSDKELREKRSRFGLVFQSFNLFPQYTAHANLTLAPKLKLDERAKREKRKNEGRIRYLKNMIRTAKVIEIKQDADRIGLFDRVRILNEKMGAEKEIQIVTTPRQNAMLGFVSKESPLGSAIMGKKVGDRVSVKVNESYSYYVKILEIKKGEDDESLKISEY